MNLRITHGGRRIRSGLALLAMASTVLMLSPAAQAQRMHGSGGSHWGGRSSGAPHLNRGSGSFSGFHHNRIGVRGGHHRGHFGGVVVIGGAGLLYPYWYPYTSYAYPYAYAYDSSVAAPVYNMPPPAQTWYYCDAAGAYYPYVTTCPGGWGEVPATPNQGSPVPQQ
jgi:hypothetical protein